MTGKEAIHNIDLTIKYGSMTQAEINSFLEYKKIIEKESEVLEILKKHIYFSSKSGCIRMKDIYKSINNFDFEDLKEWLENEI